MSNPIIQLQNRNKPEEVTDPIQIDPVSDPSSLTILVNALLSKQSQYQFYYRNERILQSLEFIIEKYNLNMENIIEIVYVDELDMKCDFIKECNDIIVSMEYFNNRLFYVTYGGLVYSLDESFSCPLKDIKGIIPCKGLLEKGNGSNERLLEKNGSNEKLLEKGTGSNERLLGFSKHSIYDIETQERLYTFDEEIRSCSAGISSNDESLMAVATTSRIFLLNLDQIVSMNKIEPDFIHKTLEFPRSVCLKGRKVYWIENHNIISSYDFEQKNKEVFKCKCTATQQILHDSSAVLVATANNKILSISNGNLVEYSVSPRHVSHLSIMGNTLLCSTQHEIIGLNICDFNEVGFMKVEGQINSMAESAEMVYIANDQEISGFLKERFLE